MATYFERQPRLSGLIVHEWIEKRGGAERVLDQMAAQFPDADIACLWNDTSDRYEGHKVFESWMSKTALRRRKALALPLMSQTWRHWKAKSSYEWVLVSSYVFAHHVSFLREEPMPRKFVYVHTPARYLWVPELDPRGASLLARSAAPFLRVQDRAAASLDSDLAANSKFIRDRIAAAWDRDSRVIYPPVDVARIAGVEDWREHLDSEEREVMDSLPETFLLGASRFVQYKGLDKVIEVGEACDLPVVIAGSGPLEQKIRERAESSSVPVFVIHAPSDGMLFALYQLALAFVFPPIEDFGIMPVEAMAAGCPVLVNWRGGTSETVSHGVSGYQLEDFGGSEVVTAVERIASLDRAKVGESVLRFDSSRFRRELQDWVGERSPSELSEHRRGTAVSACP